MSTTSELSHLFRALKAPAAARALASVVSPDELNPTYIIPSVFNPEVTTRVAAAVQEAVRGPRPPTP